MPLFVGSEVEPAGDIAEQCADDPSTAHVPISGDASDEANITVYAQEHGGLYEEFDEMSNSSNFQENPPVYVVVDNNFSANFEDFDHTPMYSQLEFDSELALCTLKHLKLLKHYSKRSSIKIQEFAKTCMLLFDMKTDDLNFMTNLTDELGFSNTQELISFMNTTPSTLQRGRHLSGIAERQMMYNFWVGNSEVSNDRRNARHVVKIKTSKLDIAVSD